MIADGVGDPAYLEVVVVVYLENAPNLPQRRAHRLGPLAVAALKDLSVRDDACYTIDPSL